MIAFRKTIPDIERHVLEADVVIVGAGPAGLACALRLAQLIDEHNAANPDSPISKERIYVLEKAREVGAHCLSGALLDPRALRELLPGFEREAPLGPAVDKEAIYFLTRNRKLKFPIIPAAMRDHGNRVVSINKLMKWLGSKVEKAGITILTGSAGSELLFEQERLVGVRTDDKGVGRNGERKSNFEAGSNLRARLLVLAEGTRGSLARQLVERCRLDRDSNPQTFGLGVKELWEVPPGRIVVGQVIYTLGHPLTSREYGGAWIYGVEDGLVSLGIATGLDSRNPSIDPQQLLQELKKHPFVSRLLEGGRMIRYGAKSLPYGGWWSIPRIAGDGWMMLGDSAGFLNSQRLKGMHLAIKSGMLAAETARDSLVKGDFSLDVLGGYPKKVENSWIKTELWPVRNFHQGFEGGFLAGMFHAAIQQATGGRGLHERYLSHPGPPRPRRPGERTAPAAGGASASRGGRADGTLTFDKLTAVYHSGTRHEEDQPAHLVIRDLDICNERCVVEFGNPCRSFCPANVYELAEAPDAPRGVRLQLSPSNCIHCKTCDIMDPYEIITWVPPEGGGGPDYSGM